MNLFSIEDASKIVAAVGQRLKGQNTRALLSTMRDPLRALLQPAARGIARADAGKHWPESGFLRVRHNLTVHDELKGPKIKSGVRDVGLPPHLTTRLANGWLTSTWPTKWSRLPDTGKHRLLQFGLPHRLVLCTALERLLSATTSRPLNGVDGRKTERPLLADAKLKAADAFCALNGRALASQPILEADV